MIKKKILILIDLFTLKRKSVIPFRLNINFVIAYRSIITKNVLDNLIFGLFLAKISITQ